ncbi:hypothetical protein [Flavobacterium sp. GCM10023249]|uniref:hypothetical protein n=1 Tax=unclassified Flavobacterium TaxID=196869 RepID=UPI00362091E9
MKNFSKKIIGAGALIACCAITLFSCSTDEPASKSTLVNESAIDGNAASRFRIKFMIGLSANLEKPSRGCDSGWGICEVTIGIVNIGFDRINMGVSSDNYLHFAFDRDQVEEETLTIESGDELIKFDQAIVEEFAKEDFDIANIALVRGTYDVRYDEASDKYIAKIPFVKK